jgi:hypothetical protein
MKQEIKEKPAGISESEFEILNGGCYRDLQFFVPPAPNAVPQTPTLETRRTLIKKISIRDMALLGKAWGTQPREAAVFLDQTPDVVATLTDDSFITVIEEGRRLNFTALSKWLNWQSETLKALGGSSQFDEIIAEAMQRVMGPMKE